MAFHLALRNPGPDAPPPFVLADHDAVIGRAAEADWTIPDPRVSARHLLIGFRDGAYLVRDTSSNGTLVNGQPLAGIHRLVPGDVLAIGGSEIQFGEGAGTTTAAPVATPAGLDGELADRLADALATLLATRRRQLGELRVTVPDALARHPLAQPARGAQPLQALPPAEAARAVDMAVEAIERHHAASVAAMQAGLRDVLAEIAPDALVSPGLPASGEAREAALWRAYVARFDGEKLGGGGFVDRFADAFRQRYEELTRP